MTSNTPMTVRHFHLGSDVALGRCWPFHDVMASRTDLDYHLHIIGPYTGPAVDLSRSYVSALQFWNRRTGKEAWIVRGWSHPLLLAAAACARMRGIPLLMWSERPGVTYAAMNLRAAMRIAVRKALLPVCFLPYRRRTLLLGIGTRAIADFCALSGQTTGHMFIYPNYIADICLGVPLRAPGDPPLLLYVGSFSHRKAIDLTIAACESAWSKGARFRIRYLGTGPLQSAVEDLQSRFADRVEICDFATGNALVQHYQDADGLLLASRHDGWGLTVHEGLARGVPVIVSDACGAADLVRQSAGGIVVPSGDPAALADGFVRWAAMSASEMLAMGQSGKALASTITMPILSDMLAAYCWRAVSEPECRRQVSAETGHTHG